MTEAVRGYYGPERVSAIKITKKIAVEILANHQDIVGVILGRRRNRERFADIAEAETDSLQRLNANTPAVRTNVVQHICNLLLGKEETVIKSDILKKRPPIVNLNQRANAKPLQKYEWTDEINRILLELAERLKYSSGTYAGKTDWKLVAAEMAEVHDIHFTPKQWKNRATGIRNYKP